MTGEYDRLILFEDEHLLVVNKPPGWNTHAPSPHANEGIYEWLKHREPRWSSLAIIHRLDKETSGVLVFSKSTAASRSLTLQFTARSVSKTYWMWTDQPVPNRKLTAESALVRVGEKYVARPVHTGADIATTHFCQREKVRGGFRIEASPVTGRTHQIRVHAAAHGFPIRGDRLYGGSPSHRLCLHARSIVFQHPVTGTSIRFEAPVDFDADPASVLRQALFHSDGTNAFRLIHGQADGWPGWHLDRLGDFQLSQSATPITPVQLDTIRSLTGELSLRGAAHKILTRRPQRQSIAEVSPQLVLGESPPGTFHVRENGLSFELSFSEGYSVGLFLDQRDNRRRLLVNHVAANFPSPCPSADAEVLNLFAYTCGFSVCAARAGARVTSVDLSEKYVDWGKRNFRLNHIDPDRHEFIRGDAFDWLRRFQRKPRRFDVIILDPPTFSRSKSAGTFRADEDYPRLMEAAVKVLHKSGTVLACSNAATQPPDRFLEAVTGAVLRAGRRILHRHYAAQPPDFPIAREEPGYLKTIWLKLD